ncbi:MAG TPA: ATP-binding protein [Candidatus Limnocylindria bacterium]|nr:ATP-binding protein [Candidatus Limnocylindria bacterium]
MPSRVLIVDDEESVTITMAAILEMDGYSVATALRGVDALVHIEREEFDLVLTDLRLDDFDGMDVLAAARRRSTETVGIVLTGYASLESAVKALREGAYDYMLKPADVEELRATVARGLERRRLGAQLRERVAELEAANRTIIELNEGLQDRVAQATADLQARVRELDEARQELQTNYEKLQELDKLKSQFLSIASHELKTPITAMSGFVQIAVRRIKRRLGAGRPDEAAWKREEETLLEQLEVVQRQTTKLARLVDELLDVSRIESGRLELRLADVDLPELVAEVLRRHQLMATKHELRLQYDSDQKLGVRGDRDHLEQVLNNLVGNAMKYSPEGGAINVTVTRAGEREVECSVGDHGIGIRPAELARVFGLFYRSPDRLARDVGGMGLGLFITKEIVDRHEGRIWADSEVGKGTTFHVALPASVAAAVGRVAS